MEINKATFQTMTELFHNNDELTKRVAELEQRNKELFERCKLLNKVFLVIPELYPVVS